MKLTKKKAIQISIELWTWLAETGAAHKWRWQGWRKYGYMHADCPLCEYVNPLGGGCASCPYYQKFGHCYTLLTGNKGLKTSFDKWCNARKVETRKKYAALFLQQLKELQ